MYILELNWIKHNDVRIVVLSKRVQVIRLQKLNQKMYVISPTLEPFCAHLFFNLFLLNVFQARRHFFSSAKTNWILIFQVYLYVQNELSIEFKLNELRFCLRLILDLKSSVWFHFAWRDDPHKRICEKTTESIHLKQIYGRVFIFQVHRVPMPIRLSYSINGYIF